MTRRDLEETAWTLWQDGLPPRVGEELGFTLVEILAALVLLSVGLLGVAALTTSALETLGRARLAEEVVAAMESVADSLRRFGFEGPGESELSAGPRVRWEGVEEGEVGAEVLIRVVEPGGGEGDGEWGSFRFQILVPRPFGSDDGL